MGTFIEAKEIKLIDLLSNAHDAYKVPEYQRPYSWTQDQWEDLFEDIEDIIDTDKVHFLGSIVVVPEGPHRFGVNYFQIVDGQQRLATLLIWLSAIRDIAKENGEDELADDFNKYYLFAKELGSYSTIPKLQLGNLDNNVFLDILKGNAYKISSKHLIYDCYKYFKNKTKDINIYKNLLQNISIVHINTFNHFNAFRLFETLNDRGLELSAVDLIKNFVLMKVSSDENIFQKTIDEWTEMYEKIRDKEPVKFIRRYILSNYRGKTSESKLYEKVCEELKNMQPIQICDFVKKLNSSASIYKKIYESNFESDKINKKLEELHIIEVAPSFTLLLKILPFYETNEISEIDILEIMEMIEILHIRWGICEQATSRLDQIYNNICMSLQDVSPSKFKEIIKQILSQEIKTKVDDDTFKKKFASQDFKPNEPRTKYILWKLSNPTGETLVNMSEIQTEHIMPRTLSKAWIEYLKETTSKTEDEIKILHEENLNRIGNLTIIKGEWNIKSSNKLFHEKKEEYSKSEFQITKELCNYEKWAFSEIEERTQKLTEAALNIWKWRW